MPIYVYKCEDEHLTEKMRKMDNRENPVECECGKPAVHVISDGNLALIRGAGWHSRVDSPMSRSWGREIQG